MNTLKFCDLTCKYASFPESSAFDGACRREISLYCKKYEKLIPKNSICFDYRKQNTQLNKGFGNTD